MEAEDAAGRSERIDRRLDAKVHEVAGGYGAGDQVGDAIAGTGPVRSSASTWIPRRKVIEPFSVEVMVEATDVILRRTLRVAA